MPGNFISNVGIVDEHSKAQNACQGNAGDRTPSEILLLHELFERQVLQSPESIAVTSGHDRITYRELNLRANQLAHHLIQLGLGPDVLAGICMERSVEMIVGMLGILKAGGAYVPLDPAYPPDRLAYMQEDAGMAVLVTQEPLLEILPTQSGVVVCLDRDRPVISEKSDQNPPAGARADNLAYVLYTSGSTGKPKGVMIEHRSIASYAATAVDEFGLGPNDRVLQFASISFDTSAEEIYTCLASGGTLVLRAPNMLDSVQTFLRQCEELGVTVLDLPTAFWHELTFHLDSLALPPSIRLVIIGGESAQWERLEAWRRSVGGQARLVNTYGPTETTVVATLCDLVEDEDVSHTVPIGRPVGDTCIYVLDPDLRTVPDGERGELYIGGTGVARGYLNRPELTAQRFIPDPFTEGPDGRLYRTGDLVRRRPDGNLEFHGRVDDQVKIRGFRVELGEIEAALRRQPNVRDAAVVPYPDAVNVQQLVAYVVPEGPVDVLTPDVRRALGEQLPGHMVPAAFVQLDTLPLTPNGKIDRRSLPPLDTSRADLERAVVPPVTALQYQLVQLWEELFNIRPIGITDDFFELGGHSLLAARLFTAIEQSLGKTIPFATLFSGATIERLAEVILATEGGSSSLPFVELHPGGPGRPFFFMHGDVVGGGLFSLKLAQHIGPDRPFYAIQPHGIDGQPIPYTMEEMAATHVETLRGVQPEGPYLLGGYGCFGSVIAFEMAQQLSEAGHEVELLTLISTVSPTLLAANKLAYRALSWVGRVTGLSRRKQRDTFLLVRDVWDRIAAVPRLSMRKKLLFGPAMLVDTVRTVAALTKRRRTPAAEPGPKPVTPPAGFGGRVRPKSDPYWWAMGGYEPRPYAGLVAMFQAEGERSHRNEPTEGWNEILSQIDLHVVPGTNATTVTEYLPILAELLRDTLRRVEPPGASPAA